jgi:hypothetical protein
MLKLSQIITFAFLTGCASQTTMKGPSGGDRLPLTTGCDPYSQTNPMLMNSQVFRFLGGKCGGNIVITANFRGTAQFYNGSDDQDAEASVDIQGPNGMSNRCAGQNWHDKHFNSFNLSCTIKDVIPPNGDTTYVLKYATNNVSDNPLPTLVTTIQYVPTQQP